MTRELFKTPFEGKKEFPLDPSQIENIDKAMFVFLDQTMNISCTTNKGFNKVEILWVSPERAFQVKNKKELRDNNRCFHITSNNSRKNQYYKRFKEKR